MYIYHIPLIIYIISSIVLIYLFLKSKKVKTYYLPQISQTGMKNINTYSYWIYFISFTIICIITSVYYINHINIKSKPYLTKFIIFLGLIACLFNIIQGYVSLDKNKILHELTAYGGIFLHLIALSIYLYYSPESENETQDKYINYCIILSWLSILLLPLFMFLYYYFLKKSKNLSYLSFNLGSIAQRSCVLFLLLSLSIFEYYN